MTPPFEVHYDTPASNGFAPPIKDDRVSPTTLGHPAATKADATRRTARVLVACPDARPPAYEAAAGLAGVGYLDAFHTGAYGAGFGRITAVARQYAPCHYLKLRRKLKRRLHRGIPADRVRAAWSFDVALALENRLGGRRPRARHAVARARTARFDASLARAVEHERPDMLFIFSDVGSECALPAARRLGIASVLSMVHGDVREELRVLQAERERSPDFFSIYLTDGPVSESELGWLHERRLREVELADRVLVPSEHIAEELVSHGTARDRIDVVPYAANVERFRPVAGKALGAECTFLFAGGICQRKGIKYLLEAWRTVRRPGWKLQLLGGMPADARPLEPYRDEVEWLGRIGHRNVARVMAGADVFVFPSLFEGSAVVTYEALACGLPSIVTRESGAVARDGIDGRLVPAGDIERLAHAMDELGRRPELRAQMSRNARSRALDFDWSRYHRALRVVVEELHGWAPSAEIA